MDLTQEAQANPPQLVILGIHPDLVEEPVDQGTQPGKALEYANIVAAGLIGEERRDATCNSIAQVGLGGFHQLREILTSGAAAPGLPPLDGRPPLVVRQHITLQNVGASLEASSQT